MTDTPTPKPLLAVAGMVERLLCRLSLIVLPWSQRSQHESYLNGYREGLADGLRRGGTL